MADEHTVVPDQMTERERKSDEQKGEREGNGTGPDDYSSKRERYGTYQHLYRETIPSVVSVYVTPGSDPEGVRTGAGSGFVYDFDTDDDEGHDGFVVTNAHVVADAEEVELRFSEGDWRAGRVVGRDAYTDLAVVAVADLPAYTTPLPVATESPEPGQRVAALGNPMGLDGTITTGVVSGVNRSVVTGIGFTIPDTVQTDAAINPGNSGGPLVTTTGEVVGVNRAKQGENIGFAISAAIVSRVVPNLVVDGYYRHSYLKVATLDVSPVVAEANGLPDAGGVLVVDVRLGPASGALVDCTGTRSVRGREIPVGGDVIVGVDGQEVRSHEELTRYLITETSPGERVTVDLRRDGDALSEEVTLGERPRPTRTSDVSVAVE
ncbi:S1C family serine protease [Halomicrococcus sp. NG-SE-24]|uniref:S1C family serine protease n=1 Tax=Halomicrococcus sp. NG-SE-24 TaxID=3436928 RepID=UPI003D9705F6